MRACTTGFWILDNGLEIGDASLHHSDLDNRLEDMNPTLIRLIRQRYWGHLLSFFAGLVLGVAFGPWLRTVVTLVFVAGVLLALYLIWVYFDKLKKQ